MPKVIAYYCYKQERWEKDDVVIGKMGEKIKEKQSVLIIRNPKYIKVIKCFYSIHIAWNVIQHFHLNGIQFS